jgi:hypothetical protein
MLPNHHIRRPLLHTPSNHDSGASESSAARRQLHPETVFPAHVGGDDLASFRTLCTKHLLAIFRPRLWTSRYTSEFAVYSSELDTSRCPASSRMARVSNSETYIEKSPH